MLYDKDTLNKDDKMAKGVTDTKGIYNLSGHATDPVGSIDPNVKIRYKCGRLLEKCYKFKVPQDYVVVGNVATKIFHAPLIELSSIKHNC